MKKLLVLTLALTLPLAQVVRANDDTDKKKKRKHQAEVAEEQRSQQAAQSQQKAAGQPCQAAGLGGATWNRTNPTHCGQVAALRGPGATPAREKRGRPKWTESRAHATVEQGQESESAC